MWLQDMRIGDVTTMKPTMTAFRRMDRDGRSQRLSYREMTLDNGQVLELISMRDAMRQARDMVDTDRYYADVFGESAYGIDSNESLWVEYADGTHFSLAYGEDVGKFRMTGATCVIIENGCTTQVAGKYRVEESVGGEGDVYYTVVPE